MIYEWCGLINDDEWIDNTIFNDNDQCPCCGLHEAEIGENQKNI